MQVEYLIIIKIKGSILKNVRSFNNLVRINDDFKINGNNLIYKRLKVRYEILTGEIKNKEQRFFHIKLSYKNVKKINDFQILLRNFREILYRTEGNVNTIWDDISLDYSNKAYPLIYELENLLRKLITKFMLITVGIEWVDETIPNEIKEVIKKKKKEKTGYTNILHEMDFIHLADFLFKPYQNSDIEILYNELRTSNETSYPMNKLKSYIPKSNWEKYFSDIVDCDDNYLNKIWKRLYELRCLVAHNNFLNKIEYEEIIKLHKELKPIIQKAVTNLDKINVPEEDKEEIAERVIGNINELLGSFIQNWRLFELTLLKLAEKNNLINLQNNKPYSPRVLIEAFRSKKLIDEDLASKLIEIIHYRNMLVHHNNYYEQISQTDLLYRVTTIRSLIDDIGKLL